ncbi:DNA cytosine methyltransferase [Curtobacterium sp. B18]|uniref:DNA cytosine methyltransferase n=1 Tax=Curtobacterium sp. B18 TaxID=95614 RepID=UPI0003B3309E|nr:DNA cytosine methyltransferase [Curtobacterium sp. B18]
MGFPSSKIAAIDLFCGAGGLSLGLQQAGIDVVAGFDFDEACRFAYETNIGAEFVHADIAEVTPEQLVEAWGDAKVRLLAGCAPCQPFSSHRRGADTSEEKNWSLLRHFGRLVVATRPHHVTMENVVRLMRMPVFAEFVQTLRDSGYAVDYRTVHGPAFGLAQSRRRLILVASRVGVVRVPNPEPAATGTSVRDVIGGLPALRHGETDPDDALHKARRLTPLNLERIQASRPGGTWRDWPEELLAPCHRKSSGASFQAFYGRMEWDKPSPTITTQSFNFGTGRFGHPEQDRSLTLREAAMLQGFPRGYEFAPKGVAPALSTVGKLIGNAVPPPFGRAVGEVFIARTAA